MKRKQAWIWFGIATLGLLLAKAVRAEPSPPGDIVLSDFDVSPDTVNPGDLVTVSLSATNMSLTETQTHKITLGGDFTNARTVSLLPGMSKQVSFEVVAPSEAGTYTVSVNGLSESFTVEILPPPPPHGILKFDLNVPHARLGEEFEFSLTLKNVGTAPLNYSALFSLDKVYLVDDYGNRITHQGTLSINESRTIWQPCVVTEYPGYYYERFGEPWSPLYHSIEANITWDGKIRRHSQGFIISS